MCECLQVLLFGESQGGHVAAKMAARIRPDLLIFISSLPEPVDAEAIRRDDITTVVGWKVVRSYARASYLRKKKPLVCGRRRRSTSGNAMPL